MGTSKKLDIVIFASGRGSNARNIIEFVKLQTLKDVNFNIRVQCLVTDNPDAGVLKYMNELQTENFVVPFENKKKEHEERILKTLDLINVDYIFLCGYMRILSQRFVKHFSKINESHSRIINIHPSLLPLFPGRNGYVDAFNANVKKSGVTIHFVDEGVDTGQIIIQQEFKREAQDDLDSFKERGLNIEHLLYKRLITHLNKNGEIIL